MRARMGSSLVLIVSALLAGLIGMRVAAGQTVLQLVVEGDTQRVRTIDHDGNGLTLGDRAAARGPLTDTAGTGVGMVYGDCVVHRRITGLETGLWNCTYVLELADGDLILKGMDPRGPGEYEMAVLGGTGAYATASGDATFTDTPERTEMMIRLSS